MRRGTRDLVVSPSSVRRHPACRAINFMIIQYFMITPLGFLPREQPSWKYIRSTIWLKFHDYLILINELVYSFSMRTKL